MKIFKMKAICLILGGSLMFSSCIGSFGLSNKVLSWNKNVNSSKFVKELLFVALWIVPVYEVCMLADILVINSIEFWSGGKNPIAKAPKKVKGENGEYLVKTLEDGYIITNEAGEELTLKFNEDAQSWNVLAGDQMIELMTMNGDGTVNMNLHNGSHMTINLDAQGVMAARQMMMDNAWGYAMR